MSKDELQIGPYAVDDADVSVEGSTDGASPESLPEPYRFPLLLIGISLTAWLAFAIGIAVNAGISEGTAVYLRLLVYGVVSTMIAVLSCVAVGRMFGSEFGEWKLAVVKLAATCLFPLTIAFGCLAVSALFGSREATYGFWVGLFAVPAFTLTLLKSFFGLEIFEMLAVMIVHLLIITACAQLISASLGVYLSP